MQIEGTDYRCPHHFDGIRRRMPKELQAREATGSADVGAVGAAQRRAVRQHQPQVGQRRGTLQRWQAAAVRLRTGVLTDGGALASLKSYIVRAAGGLTNSGPINAVPLWD